MGCIKTVKIEREDLATTVWDAGLMFVWENWTGGGCWSGLGRISGYSNGVFTSMTETGSPPGWQVIAMAENCGGGTAPTVHHEVLHALGVGHEHNRPDRNADSLAWVQEFNLITMVRKSVQEIIILSSIQQRHICLNNTSKSTLLIGKTLDILSNLLL